MILNGVMAVAMHNLTVFGSFPGSYVKVAEDTPTHFAAEYLLRYSRMLPRIIHGLSHVTAAIITIIYLPVATFKFNC